LISNSPRRGITTRSGIPVAWPSQVRDGGGPWVRTHVVALTGIVLVAGQLAWTAALLLHSYFRQDDFVLAGAAVRQGIGWSYLMTPYEGHLMPAGLAITWAVSRISLDNWPLATAIVLVLMAAASLAMLRMLLTVFDRASAGILIPLTLYLFSPLLVGAAAWWSVALRVLPFQAAMFMAVATHIGYLRSGGGRRLAATAGWLVLGMACADQGVLVPLLLFALTAAFFTPGRPRAALALHKRAWLVYGTLIALYCLLFFAGLASSGAHVAGPGKATSLYEFAATMLGLVVAPSVLGGPWQWASTGYAQAAPPHPVEYLAWAVAAAVVLVSCLARKVAWRAWVILLGWLVGACVLPVAVEGFALFATTLGGQTGFVANATGVLALCAGLAFLPVGEPAGEPAGEAAGQAAGEVSSEATSQASRPARVLGIVTFCCFVAGAAVSLQSFVTALPSATARSYIATARTALDHAPRGTVIVDSATPAAILNPAFFPAQARTELVLGDLGSGHRVRWIAAPEGVITPMIFNDAGKLSDVTVAGARAVRPPRGNACWNVTSDGALIPIAATMYQWTWTGRIVYRGPAGLLDASFGDGRTVGATIPAGAHVLYLPLTGAGSRVQFYFYGATAQPLCITTFTVGLARAAS
jgi:hypothetical protein